jgi:phage tail-like protein
MTAPRRAEPREPFTNTRFRVEITGMRDTGALEVVFPEGRIVHASRRGASARYGSLILRRGLTRSAGWYGWWDLARKSKRAVKRDVAVVLLDARGEDANRWTFSDVRPLAYQVSSLNALGGEVLIETLELAVGGFKADYAAEAGVRSGSRRDS